MIVILGAAYFTLILMGLLEYNPMIVMGGILTRWALVDTVAWIKKEAK